ncbi:hypothetical protein [Xylanimonas sp. McL0601]|uniref:hypothetical protein n=1 Tax=Xylanimonas sp. McL0601 TaxID=3414739 RepID=UPI003CE856B9
MSAEPIDLSAALSELCPKAKDPVQTAKSSAAGSMPWSASMPATTAGSSAVP